jgi:hypothetical protein
LQFKNRTWHTTGYHTVCHEQGLCGHGGHPWPPGLDGQQIPDLEPLYSSCRRRSSTSIRRTLLYSGPSSWHLTARSMMLLKGIRIQRPHDYFCKCSDYWGAEAQFPLDHQWLQGTASLVYLSLSS